MRDKRQSVGREVPASGFRSGLLVKHGLWLWAPVAIYMAVIFGLSSMTNPPEPPEMFSLVSDKAIHALLYGGLSALIVRALAGGWLRPIPWQAAALAAVLSTLYGASDEVHQYFVPPRQMDALDLVADFAGASIASLGLFGVSRQKPSAAAALADRR